MTRTDSADQSDGLSRRSFIALAAGAAGALALGSESAEAQGSADDLTSLTLLEVSDRLRHKRVSPVELTQACLARIERLNPSLNAFITVTAESALESARTAEGEIQHGRWRGPLHGVPIAVKDLFDTAGVRTTAGSGVFKDRIPTEDAEVVRRLRSAGAILLGKTNMHEFAYGGTSAVSYFGAVRNPWDTSRIPGGSSGGSAAAVAANLCYAALGTDTAASVRQPAAYCGVVGVKPTYGLVSTRGCIPLSWTFDHVGPFARTVADSAVVLQAIAGYDRLDTGSRMIAVPDYSAALAGKVSALRVGVARTFFFDDLDPEIEAAMLEAIRVLQKVATSVHDLTLPASTQEALRAAVRQAEAYAYHAEFVEKSPELYQPETLARLRAAMDAKTTSYILGRREVDLTRRTIGDVYKSVDVIITPTVPVPPPLIADVSKDVTTSMSLGARTIRNTSPFNVYGWPTVSVPCGFTSAGLPIGMQISGPDGSEARVLQVAHAYEQTTTWHLRRPGVS